MPNSCVYILDRHQQPVPIGVTGELYIGGAGVARGYLGRPDLTAERFLKNPFAPGRMYKTGDLARYLPSGDIEFLGRADHQVKIRGFRLELGEVEAVIAADPAIATCAVLLRTDSKGDKSLVAYVVPQTGRAIDVEALRDQVTQKLPDYARPASYVQVPALPLNPNGKLDRNALPAPEPHLEPSAQVLPRTAAEQRLAEIFQTLLGIPSVGIHADFFALGGHSLLAAQLVSHASRAGLNLTIRDLFLHPTIAELARALPQAQPLSCVVPLKRGSGAGAVILLPGADGTLYAMGMLARKLSTDCPIWGVTTPPLAGIGAMPSTLAALCAVYAEQLQQQVPGGPLWLAGHSFGGCVAIELAAQLAAKGHHIAQIILMDSWAPRQRSELTPRAQLHQVAKTFALPLDTTAFFAMSDAEARDHVLAALAANKLGSTDPQAWLGAVLDSAQSSQSMLRSWSPPPPAAAVHLLRAAEVRDQALPDHGWGSFFPLASNAQVAGDHFSMLSSLHLDATAAAVSALLASVSRISH